MKYLAPVITVLIAASAFVAAEPSEDSIQANYGSARITFYHSSQKCTGPSTTLTIPSPKKPAPGTTRSTVYGKCFHPGTYSSFKILSISEEIQTECGIDYYYTQQCKGPNYELGLEKSKKCQNAIVNTISGDYPSVSFQMWCVPPS